MLAKLQLNQTRKVDKSCNHRKRLTYDNYLITPFKNLFLTIRVDHVSKSNYVACHRPGYHRSTLPIS